MSAVPMITCLFDEKSNCVTLRACGELGFLRTAQALQWALEISSATRAMLVVLEDETAAQSALELRSLAPVFRAWRERHQAIQAAVVVPSESARIAVADALQRAGEQFKQVPCYRSEQEAGEFLDLAASSTDQSDSATEGRIFKPTPQLAVSCSRP